MPWGRSSRSASVQRGRLPPALEHHVGAAVAGPCRQRVSRRRRPGRSRTSASASTSTEEVRRWRADLKARGVVSEEEKREDCCYAVQDKFWLTDPDGNRWEVYTVLEDIEDVAREKLTACCAK